MAGGDDEPHLLEELKQKQWRHATVQQLAGDAGEGRTRHHPGGGRQQRGRGHRGSGGGEGHSRHQRKADGGHAGAGRADAGGGAESGYSAAHQLAERLVAAWQELARRALAGDIGELRYTRYRSAHNGPVAIGCAPSFVRDLTTPEINGAGALMDYCCYGANLAALLLGVPQSVTGMRGVFGDEPAYAASDDNAIIMAKYPHAFGVCEASWTQPVGYAGTNPVVYGSGGSLGIHGGKMLIQRPGKTRRCITPPDTQYPHRSAPEYLIHCLENNLPIEGFCSPQISRNAQEILEAGLRAANTGQTQTLPIKP